MFALILAVAGTAVIYKGYVLIGVAIVFLAGMKFAVIETIPYEEIA